jgi:hypothetical protein
MKHQAVTADLDSVRPPNESANALELRPTPDHIGTEGGWGESQRSPQGGRQGNRGPPYSGKTPIAPCPPAFAPFIATDSRDELRAAALSGRVCRTGRERDQ